VFVEVYACVLFFIQEFLDPICFFTLFLVLVNIEIPVYEIHTKNSDGTKGKGERGKRNGQRAPDKQTKPEVGENRSPTTSTSPKTDWHISQSLQGAPLPFFPVRERPGSCYFRQKKLFLPFFFFALTLASEQKKEGFVDRGFWIFGTLRWGRALSLSLSLPLGFSQFRNVPSRRRQLNRRTKRRQERGTRLPRSPFKTCAAEQHVCANSQM